MTGPLWTVNYPNTLLWRREILLIGIPILQLTVFSLADISLKHGIEIIRKQYKFIIMIYVTCRSCFAASAATRELNVTNPTGCKVT